MPGPNKDRKRGKFYAPHPLDFGIIERLPNEGTTLGFHTIAMPARALTEELNADVPREAWVKTSQVTGRLVSMKSAGYVVQVVMIGQNERWGWQRTTQGVRHYEKQAGHKLPTNGPKLRVIENEPSPRTDQTEAGGQ
jgi:hypothetical protein